jgi:hypothetical protein
MIGLGISALNYFVQLNWTGPAEKVEPEWLELPNNKELFADILLDTECLCPNIQGIHWLILARIIFLDSRQFFAKYKVCVNQYKIEL